MLFSRKEIEMCFSSRAPLKQSSAVFKTLDMKYQTSGSDYTSLKMKKIPVGCKYPPFDVRKSHQDYKCDHTFFMLQEFIITRYSGFFFNLRVENQCCEPRNKQINRLRQGRLQTSAPKPQLCLCSLGNSTVTK